MKQPENQINGLVESESTPSGPCHVLVVEDNPDHMDIVRRALSEHQEFDIVFADSITQAFKQLTTKSFQIILSDYCLPDGLGTDLIEWIPNCPVIIMTSQGNEEIAVDSLKQGAFDYLVKNVLLPDLVVDAIKKAQLKFNADREIEILKSRLAIEINKVERTEKSLGKQRESTRELIDLLSNTICGSIQEIYNQLGIIKEELAGPLTMRQKDCLGAAFRACDNLEKLVSSCSKWQESDLDSLQSKNLDKEKTRAIDLSDDDQLVVTKDSNARILIVDDDINIIELIRRALITTGLSLELYHATDGAMAWKAICDVDPHVLILDINIEKINGADILKRIKTDPKLHRAKVIMMSGVPEVLKDMKKLGADTCLQKPFDIQELLKEVTNDIKPISSGTPA